MGRKSVTAPSLLMVTFLLAGFLNVASATQTPPTVKKPSDPRDRATAVESYPKTRQLAQWGGGKKGKRGKKGMKGMRGGGGLSPEVMAAFMAKAAENDAMDARGFVKTGLRPVYPDGLDCRTANSFFADETRGDGSTRSWKFYQGRHGGLDIPAKGIEIITMADGEIIYTGTGSGIGGTGVILRHAPEDTGLDHWTFTEYKHLKEPSTRPMGSRIGIGEVVGIAWNTGTTFGRAYGPSGHYHLHLSTWYNATGEFKKPRAKPIPVDGYWTDPLAMMRGGPLESAAANSLADDEKAVRFAYKSADGAIHPEGARIIWPLVCR